MARVVGYTGPRWVIENAGGNFATLSVGSGVKEVDDGVLCLSHAERAGVVDDEALLCF